jgi:4-carboxymuconolactone decarboxylase
MLQSTTDGTPEEAPVNFARTLIFFAAFLVTVGHVTAQDRMPPIPIDKMTDAQKKAADAVIGSQRGGLIGPFAVLVRSPELMSQLQGLGDYIHFNKTIGSKLTEFTILVTVRQWTQQLEWNAHLPVGLKAGLEPEVMTAVGEGRRPTGMTDDEDIIYDFCTELHQNQSVSDVTYARAAKRFGEQGVLDLVGTIGYYALQSMVLNVARTPTRPSNTSIAAFPH